MCTEQWDPNDLLEQEDFMEAAALEAVRILTGDPHLWAHSLRFLRPQRRAAIGQSVARETPVALGNAVKDLIRAVQPDLTPGLRELSFAYLTVGSANMDYRSMVMDGEVLVTVTGWETIMGLIDFLLLPGLCEWIDWVDNIDRLNELLPPPSGFNRKMANLMKLAL
jgi:hypothetical protein